MRIERVRPSPGWGGVRVTISDAETGEVLAEGLTEGETGSTERIMKTPRGRGQPLSTEGAAAFRATIDGQISVDGQSQDLSSHDYVAEDDVLVAILSGFTGHQMAKISKPILRNSKFRDMVKRRSKNGNGNDDDVRSVVYGADGALAGLGSGSVLVDHTTASAELARELEAAAADQNCGFLDAPVSGGQAGAENGALTVMTGGAPDVFERVRPVMSLVAPV